MEKAIEQRVMTALLRKIEGLIEVQPMNEDVQFSHGYAALKKSNLDVVHSVQRRLSTSQNAWKAAISINSIHMLWKE